MPAGKTNHSSSRSRCALALSIVCAGAALTLALYFSSGCSPQSAQSSTSSPSPPGAPSWDWAQYPPVADMRLAIVPCQVLPKSSISLHSPLAGTLRVYASQPQTNYAAGTIWAEFDPQIFRHESNALAEAKTKLDQREELQLHLELPKEKLKLEKEIEEARRQVALLNLLSTNEELSRITFDYGLKNENPLKPEAVAKAKLSLDLLEQSMGYLTRTNLLLLGIDLAGQRTEWEQRHLDFERRQGQAQLRMPFTGQLTISLPLSEGVEEYPVTMGQELGVARDLTQIRIRVTLANPAWAALPTDHLKVLVRLPSGQQLEAPFLFQNIEKVQFRDESVFYFQFRRESAAQAARLIGTDLSCELWLNLAQPARIIPKYNLVLQLPAAFQGRDWRDGVQTAWPGAKLLVEGQTSLAVALATDPAKL